ncbi:MAG TPA: Gfo/Idh/MocA family oxidoreductase [Bacillota bacterium]|nr:Gfo/Idh/MocA family oxidoreductase [Bacillota bacterium]
MTRHEKKLKFGIVGCGMIGRIHAKALFGLENAELVAVCDNSAKGAQTIGTAFGAEAFTDYGEMLRSGIDAVCICTPSGLHEDLAVRAAQAGVNFITEKPLALSVASADRVIAACKKYGVTGSVVSQLRFSPDIIAVREAVAEGLIGKLFLVNLSMKYYRSKEYYASSPWRGTWTLDGGGALMNQGIHGVDIMLHVCGACGEVSVTGGAVSNAVHKIETEDTAVASMRFANGALGTLCASTAVVPACNRLLSLHGDRGTIVLEEDTIKGWYIPDNDITVSPVMESKHVTSYTPQLSSEAGHASQLSDFIDSIITGRSPAVTLEDGRRAVKLICDVYEAAGIYKNDR